MKALFTFSVLGLLVLAGCGGGGNTSRTIDLPPAPTPSSNQWTWVGGSQFANPIGSYGTQGTAAPTNTPGGRRQPVSWTDAAGNFWLFGGEAAPSSTTDNLFNDLWKYSANQWTWVSGANAANQRGTYGTQGAPAPTNVPGARTNAVGWTDSSGNLWLFGGLGLDRNGTSNYLNDLWKFSAGQWTWMGGSDVGTQTQPGIYGTKGTAAPANLPGARGNAVSWKDASGNFWLFGGFGLDSAGTLGYLNDLWEYTGGQWVWMSGSNLANQPGVYGTQGTAAAINVPGARSEAAGWVDTSGNLWLFGGTIGPTGSFQLVNDLWKYSAGQWTWMGGSNAVNQKGVYGTKGTAAAANVPGGRVAPVTWVDSAGNFWLFGGNGFDSAGKLDFLSDLWKYSGGQWTWVNGPGVAAQPGAYGAAGTAGSANVPGARFAAAGWKDSSGNLWLFGGHGFDSIGILGDLNDLWKYTP